MEIIVTFEYEESSINGGTSDTTQESPKVQYELSLQDRVMWREFDKLVPDFTQEKEDLNPVPHQDSLFPEEIEAQHKVIVSRHKPTYLYYASNREIIN